ncbi:MAG TPA: hypothetical protein VML75_26345 [Kofleriaceae bacterium]|nr:hypothetical protein [Kofleriaceae bacterium]
MTARLGTLASLAAGARLIGRYPRLVAALYLVQLMLSSLAGLVVARALAIEFARRPLFDRAADGDLLSLLTILNDHDALFSGALWACIGFVIAYAMISWFTTAGLLATATSQPVGARATAERFGAGGAANVAAFARLAGWSLIPYAAIAVVGLIGLAAGVRPVELSDSLGTTVGHALLGLTPALLTWWITNTAVDFARIELVTRERKSALRALLRGYATVFSDRRPLPLAGLFYVAIIGVTTVYATAIAGIDLSWLALLALRQLVAITRFLAKVCLLGAEVVVAAPGPVTP